MALAAARMAQARRTIADARQQGAMTPAESGMLFRQHLLKEYKVGDRTAFSVCSASYFATLAGCRGVEDLGFDPARGSKHASEHLKNALDRSAIDQFYWANIPVYDRVLNRRDVVPIPFYLPHEAFNKIMSSRSGDFVVSALGCT